MTELEQVVTAKDEAARKQVCRDLELLPADTKKIITVDEVISGLIAAGASADAAKIMAPAIVKEVNGGGKKRISIQDLHKKWDTSELLDGAYEGLRAEVTPEMESYTPAFDTDDQPEHFFADKEEIYFAQRTLDVRRVEGFTPDTLERCRNFLQSAFDLMPEGKYLAEDFIFRDGEQNAAMLSKDRNEATFRNIFCPIIDAMSRMGLTPREIYDMFPQQSYKIAVLFGSVGENERQHESFEAIKTGTH